MPLMSSDNDSFVHRATGIVSGFSPPARRAGANTWGRGKPFPDVPSTSSNIDSVVPVGLSQSDQTAQETHSALKRGIFVRSKAPLTPERVCTSRGFTPTRLATRQALSYRILISSLSQSLSGSRGLVLTLNSFFCDVSAGPDRRR